jgi:hypothetical protein
MRSRMAEAATRAIPRFASCQLARFRASLRANSRDSALRFVPPHAMACDTAVLAYARASCMHTCTRSQACVRALYPVTQIRNQSYCFMILLMIDCSVAQRGQVTHTRTHDTSAYIYTIFIHRNFSFPSQLSLYVSLRTRKVTQVQGPYPPAICAAKGPRYSPRHSPCQLGQPATANAG